ncbi:MAG: glycoside hydrolase family 95 protein, partial [Clostridiales bacterium]|nr:glycoside hydrolase family 95 protein [Clostridiales bacterium]
IWNEHLRAPWSSNYTININTQMNYWGTDSVNLSECFEPLTELVKKIADNGRKTAKDYYGCGGFCSHHNSDIWGCTQPATSPDGDSSSEAYAFWQASAPWFLNMLYDHYVFLKDENYKAEILPLFKGCLDFYNDFLIEKDGVLVTCPSLSPENTFKTENGNGNLTYMPSMDREILHDFFENCRLLGLDAPNIEQVKPASDGRIPEWAREYGEVEVHHRHISHLYCIYPSSESAGEKLEKAADKSMNTRGEGGTGWSLAWKVCVRARMRQPEKAARLLANQLKYVSASKYIKYARGGTYPNLFCAHPPFQIDGNFGVMAGIAEMILNNSMPKEWNGRIKGLKRADGSEVNAEIKNGKLIF